MTRTHALYIALGVLGGLAVGLTFAGSLGALAPLAILLVCPLMMLVMMRSMNHGSPSHDHRRHRGPTSPPTGSAEHHRHPAPTTTHDDPGRVL